MRKLTRSPKQKPNLPLSKEKFTETNLDNLKKITFRCDTFLLDKVKNNLASQHLAGNYRYSNLSYFFRSALHAYQHGMTLTYQRESNNPRKEVSFRLTEELLTFYNSLPPRSKTAILERALGTYFYQYLN